jgi:hypothetical protein
MAKIGFRTKQEIAKVRAGVRRRQDIDKVAEAAGYTSHLMNFHLAQPFDLTELGIGRGAYVPVMISKRSGGRKSMFDLLVGESAVVGALISDDGILLRHVLRKKGGPKGIAAGDIIRETWQNLDGKVVSTGNITVTAVNTKNGQITGEGSTSTPAGKWIYKYECNCWSCCTETIIVNDSK